MEDQAYACPHCHGPVTPTSPADDPAPLYECPHCGQPFSVDPDPTPEDAPPQDQELDALRIQKIAIARRSAIRARSYCLIGLFASAVTAAELIWKAQERWTGRSIIYLLLAALFCGLGVWLFIKARELAKEAAPGQMPEPAVPPDFSTLGDGSQIGENLQRLNEK